MMNRIPLRVALLALAALISAAPGASAQVPKVGVYHTDKTDLGFHVRVPAEWDLIPPQPSDGANVIATYVPPVLKYITLDVSKEGRSKDLWMRCWILKFDRRKTDEAATKAKEGPMRFTRSAAKDFPTWLKDTVEDGAKLKLLEQRETSVNRIATTEYQYVTEGEPKSSIRYYASVYKLLPDVEVAVLFNGPGDPKKWTKWESPFTQMLRSFGAVDTKELEGATPQGESLRDKVRAEQVKKIATLPGWKLHETPHYFIVTPHEDRAFVEELKQRLEEIHKIYEQDYPVAKAEEYRKAGESARTGDAGKSAEDKAQEAAEKAFKEMMSGGADAKELGNCSVVRVFTDHDAYMAYGAPGGSAGYWSPMDRELVLYDDQKGGGRKDTWSVLNHEGFHQYIFYFFGALSPHSWYNEGTGDFYSGYAWKNGRFVLERFAWRVDTIKELIRDKKHAPLDKFVRFSQAEYYGRNDIGASIGNNYAQGWSLIYFLRTGKKAGAKGWDPSWDSILETYLRVLAMTNKLDQAVEEAFRGVDMKALETAWMAYTL